MSVQPRIRKLGPYVMLHTLGSGGFSKVKLGYDEEKNEHVALKILKRDAISTNSTTFKQVQREIAAMAKIQHKNVIQLKRVDWDAVYTKKNGTTKNVILVVLELATGGELFEYLAFTGFFEEAMARAYLHQLIEGISHCHAQGIAHRDLKPENLLLDTQFVLKIADFGFANAFNTGDGSGDKLMYTECGTPGYMAPEMFERKRGYDAQGADVWACGVILFIMVAGFPPFQKPNLTDWWFQKLASNKHNLFWEAHSRTAYFSDSIKDFINKVLAPDPTRRMTLQDIKKHPWYLGETMSQSALYSAFQRRKAAVDEGKAKERMEKKQARGGGFQDEDMVDRALGDEDSTLSPESDTLPESAPFGLRVATRQETVATTRPAENASLLQHITRGAGDELGDETPKASVPCQVYAPSIPVLTQFESKQSVAALEQRIISILSATGNGKYSYDDTQHKFKTSIILDDFTTELTIQIFKHPSVQDTHVVEIRRRSGDAVHFRSVYNEIRDAMRDVICKKQVIEVVEKPMVVAKPSIIESMAS